MIHHVLINSVQILVLTFELFVKVNIGPSVDLTDELLWIEMTYINLCSKVMKKDSHASFIISSLANWLERSTELVEVMLIAKPRVVSFEVDNPSISFLFTNWIWIVGCHTVITI